MITIVERKFAIPFQTLICNIVWWICSIVICCIGVSTCCRITISINVDIYRHIEIKAWIIELHIEVNILLISSKFQFLDSIVEHLSLWQCPLFDIWIIPIIEYSVNSNCNSKWVCKVNCHTCNITFKAILNISNLDDSRICTHFQICRNFASHRNLYFSLSGWDCNCLLICHSYLRAFIICQCNYHILCTSLIKLHCKRSCLVTSERCRSIKAYTWSKLIAELDINYSILCYLCTCCRSDLDTSLVLASLKTTSLSCNGNCSCCFTLLDCNILCIVCCKLGNAVLSLSLCKCNLYILSSSCRKSKGQSSSVIFSKCLVCCNGNLRGGTWSWLITFRAYWFFT